MNRGLARQKRNDGLEMEENFGCDFQDAAFRLDKSGAASLSLTPKIRQ
jgi:hypothetical protein